MIFNHESHVAPDTPSCGVCHKALFKINEPGTPLRGGVSYERIHEEDLCASCHDGSHAFSIEDDCTFCHQG